MFKNHLKITVRSLLNSKSYSLINIGGLSVGIACFILTAIYVRHEFSYDNFSDGAEDVYRLAIKSTTGDGSSESIWALSYVPLGEHMKPHFPEIEKYGRISGYAIGETVVRYGDSYDQFIKERLFYYADPEIIEMFGYEIINGNVLSELKRPNTIVLTRSFSEKLFGDRNPIGEVLKFGGNDQFEIVGVIGDYKDRSHFGFEGIISYETFLENRNEESRTNDWRWSQCRTYLQLYSGNGPDNINSNFPGYWNSEVPQWKGKRERIALMQPLTSIHLESDISYELQTNGNIYYVYLFGMIGIFILLLAIINYMNLATARSMKRMKEIGIRKVMGSGRYQLIRQFLTESVLIVSLSTILAILWIEMTIPVFGDLAGKDLSFSWWEKPEYVAILSIFVILTGVMSGSYPAFYLSAFPIFQVLRNASATDRRSMLVRKVLVVIQFSITTILLLATFVVNSQLNFMFNQNLGFEKDQVIILHDDIGSEEILPSIGTIKQELEAVSGVGHVAFTSSLPVGQVYENGIFVEVEDEMQPFIVKTLWVDEYFVPTLGLYMLRGRNFSLDLPSDSVNSFIINEAAMHFFGWNEAVGKRMRFGLEPDGSYRMNGTVIGLLKDFQLSSAHNQIEPLVMMRGGTPWGYLIARVNISNLKNTLAGIEEKWSQVYPNVPLDVSFLDSRFNEQYRAESKLLELFGYLSGVSIMIACLGLFGLASFMTEQRTKEIGIRKVVGASVRDLMLLLSKDFLILVGLAFVLSIPIGYLLAENWLNNFAFRVGFSVNYIVLSGLTVLLVSLLSVGFKALRAALSNPVDSLRYE